MSVLVDDYAPMNFTNTTQVGGCHYKMKWQLWDFIEIFNVGYLEANAAKYVVRWENKNGLEDLEKAVHYLTKLTECYYTNNRRAKSDAEPVNINQFISKNKFSSFQEVTLAILLGKWKIEDVVSCITIIKIKMFDYSNEVKK